MPIEDATRILAGRGILITAGSSATGKAVARSCVSAGADIAICGRSASSLEETNTELQAILRPEQCLAALVADVSDSAAVTHLVSSVKSRLPGFCGVVNAAGILGPKGDLDEVDL